MVYEIKFQAPFSRGGINVQHRGLEMALKLVRKKKAKLAAASGKKSTIEKFKDAIDVQLRMASGEKVKKGTGLAKSWMKDGDEYDVEKVLEPRVGSRLLYPKSSIAVNMKQKTPPTNELKELRGMVVAGKLSNRIYKAVAAKKK